jgi:hypothetical protein
MPRKGDRFDLSGRKFGRLLVVAFHHQDAAYRSFFACVCDCGSTAIAEGYALKRGLRKSCGCSRRKALTHGATVGGRWAPEYRSWAAMLARVRPSTGRRARDYSERGIKVCDRWLRFENFLADMGSRSKGTSIDRINNDGNYEPSNCRWATILQQRYNRRDASRLSA